jgi:hypothetical protein
MTSSGVSASLSTSLRANGSRECARDDRLREEIQKATDEALDCFVAEFIIEPAEGRTRWLLAMTNNDAGKGDAISLRRRRRDR